MAIKTVLLRFLPLCSEMAPPAHRGRLNQLYQLVLTFFILVAYVINLIVHVVGAERWGWRLSLGFAFVPSFLLFLGGVFLPDSPNSLLERNRPEQVRAFVKCVGSACGGEHSDA